MDTLIGTPDPEPYDHDQAAAEYRARYESIMQDAHRSLKSTLRFPRPAKSKR